MTNQLDGGCLCGRIRYSCDAAPALTALCHCRHCQKQTSAPYSIVVAVPKGSLVIERGALKTFLDTGDNGQQVERSFCPDCGSPIRSFVAALPALEFIKAGTLDDTSWLAPTMELWCETAQPWMLTGPPRQRIERNPPLS
ncbi:MAG: GFA family protein [Geminicoccaceae bacterium]